MVEAKAIIRANREDKYGNCPIYIQYVNDQKPVLFFTGIKVPVIHWDKKRQLVNSLIGISNTKSNQTLREERKREDGKKNSTIGLMKSRINQIILDLLHNDIVPTVEEVKTRYNGENNNKEKKEKLLDVFDQYLEFKRDVRPKLSVNTIKHYTTLKNHLENFSDKKKLVLKVNEIDNKFYNKFLKYLFDDLEHSNNTVGTQVKELKTFMNWAVENGYVTNFAYKKFKKPKAQANFTYLTNEELDLLARYDFSNNKRLEEVRDLFVLSCATGLRFSDYSRLSKMNKLEDAIDTDFQNRGS